MTIPHFRTGDRPRHASQEDYEAFVRRYADPHRRSQLLVARRVFVDAYPDLTTWLTAPLPERVLDQGRRGPHGGRVKPAWERAYLIYLALHGYLQLDWAYLLAVPSLSVLKLLPYLSWETGIDQLGQQMQALGYSHTTIHHICSSIVVRVFLHRGYAHIDAVRDEHLHALLAAAEHYIAPGGVALSLHPNTEGYGHPSLKILRHHIYALRVALYHRGQIAQAPRRRVTSALPPCHLPPRMQDVLDRYIVLVQLDRRPATVSKMRGAIRHFARWLMETHPDIETFADVRREHIEGFIAALHTRPGEQTRRPWGALMRRGVISNLNVFFTATLQLEWADVPTRCVISAADMPKVPLRLPRPIPREHLDRLMEGVRDLPCPYQRTALLVARWSGGRRDEIRRLARTCLDSYADGTPRLHIPVGKTQTERKIPLHDEAAQAISALLTVPPAGRGLVDSYTGEMTDYLFMQHGRLLSAGYLFSTPLGAICMAKGLPSYTAHQLRHTVGTQLAEKKARLQTIMTILGHASARMSMSYIALSDDQVREEYQAALGRENGDGARVGHVFLPASLPQEEVDWLKSNFFKSELELGHCLRLPEEGPCECDLYLYCPSFLTTPEKAPRLRRRRRIELSLTEDARSRGWTAEIERHLRLAARCEDLLNEMGEPLDGPEEEDG